MNQRLRVLGLVSVIAFASGCAKQATLRPLSASPPTEQHTTSELLGPIQPNNACATNSAAGCDKAALVNVYYLVRN